MNISQMSEKNEVLTNDVQNWASLGDSLWIKAHSCASNQL